jgi:hypothetical protein
VVLSLNCVFWRTPWGVIRRGPISSMIGPVFLPGPSALNTFARIVDTGPLRGSYT